MRSDAKAYECSACFERYCNADRPAPYDRWRLPDGTPSRVCLLPMVTDASRELLRLADHYRAGHLPRAGGVLNQPNKFLQALELINIYGGSKTQD